MRRCDGHAFWWVFVATLGKWVYNHPIQTFDPNPFLATDRQPDIKKKRQEETITQHNTTTRREPFSAVRRVTVSSNDCSLSVTGSSNAIHTRRHGQARGNRAL
eukprot:m.142205 g.142205  ORF g.142205 m.142205 type:complete len:103 (-) comp14052_c0_seq1:2419-2727(-)